MAIPVARVHLKMAHAALPALLPTPPKWKMLPPPCPCLAAIILQAKPPPLAVAKPKPSRADSVERWDAHKTKAASKESSAASSSPRSADSVRSSAGRGSFSFRKNATSPSPPPKPGRADSVERWDAHKKASSPSSSSGKWTISRASSAERWDVHKKRCGPPPHYRESSSTASNDIDDTEEEEILWKPRAMYAGPGFIAAAPEPEHASNADTVLGSRCIALHCTNSIDRIMIQAAGFHQLPNLV